MNALVQRRMRCMSTWCDQYGRCRHLANDNEIVRYGEPERFPVMVI